MYRVHSLRPGTILAAGAYRIVRVLGKGSFGITYLVEDINPNSPRYGRKVALKEFFMSEINSRGEGASEIDGTGGNVFVNYRNKFKKEASNLASLDHPNIVKVYDVFEQNNTAYYAMEFIEGMNLDDYITREGHLDEKETVKIVRKVADALYYMHARQMLHLDIKPKNIMLSAKGEHVYLIDFGLSKQFSSSGEPESSTLGLGTPGYAPPEQGNEKLDGRFPSTLDVYALGGTMYKMLTGHRPPVATDILNNGFPRQIWDSYQVSAVMKELVEKAMAPRVADRFRTMLNLSKQLPKETSSNNSIDRIIITAFCVVIIVLVITIFVLIGSSTHNNDSKIRPPEDQQQQQRAPGVANPYDNERAGSDNVLEFSANGVPFKMIKVEGGPSGTFYIGQTEVTQKLWEAVMGSNPSYYYGLMNPVENMSYYDCQKFINRLNEITGHHFRLPTASEWEYAARGGNQSRGYTYSGSNDIFRVANFGNSSGSPQTVAQMQPNELGIYDMSGNVWERCAKSGSTITSRGGSFYFDESLCRIVSKSSSAPGDCNRDLGLRLAL